MTTETMERFVVDTMEAIQVLCRNHDPQGNAFPIIESGGVATFQIPTDAEARDARAGKPKTLRKKH